MSNSLKSRFKKAELKPENINSETEPIIVEPIIEEKTTDNETVPENNIVDASNDELTMNTIDLVKIEEDLTSLLKEKISKTPVWFDYTKERQAILTAGFCENYIHSKGLDIADTYKKIISDNLSKVICDFGAVQYLIDNEKVDAVFINSTKSVYIEIDEKLLDTDIKLDNNQLKFIINSIKHLTDKENFAGFERFKIDNILITLTHDIYSNGPNIVIKKLKNPNDELIENNFIIPDYIYEILSTVRNSKNVYIQSKDGNLTPLSDINKDR